MGQEGAPFMRPQWWLEIGFPSEDSVDLVSAISKSPTVQIRAKGGGVLLQVWGHMPVIPAVQWRIQVASPKLPREALF